MGWKKPAREVSGGVLHLNLKIVMWVNVEGLSICVFVDGWLMILLFWFIVIFYNLVVIASVVVLLLMYVGCLFVCLFVCCSSSSSSRSSSSSSSRGAQSPIGCHVPSHFLF